MDNKGKNKQVEYLYLKVYYVVLEDKFRKTKTFIERFFLSLNKLNKQTLFVFMTE